MRLVTRRPLHRRPLLPRAATGSAMLLVLLGLLVAGSEPARADSIEVGAFAERSTDPSGITFSARVSAPAGVRSARLVYKVRNPDGDIGGSGEAQPGPGAQTDVSFSLETNTGERYIPVGSTLVYHWEIEDTTGSRVSTPEREYLFLDGRYQWRSRTEGTNPPVTVYWYGANEARANQALEATRTSLRNVGELLQTTVQYPVKVMVWGSEAEGEAAKRPRGRTFDATVSTGGQRVAPDLVFVFIPQVDIILHEVGHIVTHVAGDGPFGALPSWLDEGVAVWAQGSPGPGYAGALALAIQANDTLNLRSMQSPTNRPDEVNLFYGQAYSTVDYLIREHGRGKFAELFRVFREGTSIDAALQQVYGFDQNGLYNAWRQSKGLAPVAFATPAAGAGAPGVEATRPPLGIPTSVAGGAEPSTGGGGAPTTEGAQPAASGDGGSNARIAVLGATVVLAALLGGAAFMLLRRRGGTSTAA